MLLLMTLLFLVIVVTGVPASIYCFHYIPKKQLSPSDYASLINQIAEKRQLELESATSDFELDRINTVWDNETKKYKISRR